MQIEFKFEFENQSLKIRTSFNIPTADIYVHWSGKLDQNDQIK